MFFILRCAIEFNHVFYMFTKELDDFYRMNKTTKDIYKSSIFMYYKFLGAVIPFCLPIKFILPPEFLSLESLFHSEDLNFSNDNSPENGCKN